MISKVIHGSAVLLIVLIFISSSNSQLRDYGVKIGAQINAALPASEYWESHGLKESYLSRVFCRFEIAEPLHAEFGIGYGSLAGFDFNMNYYRTEIIPFEGRFLLNLGESDFWNPYLYAGFGALSFRVTHLASVASPKPTDEDGFTGIIPAGIGTEFKISDNILFDVSLGANYSLSDNLNNYNNGFMKDGYYNAGVGFIFVSESGESDDDHDGLMNNEEKELRTDPDNPDTDGDGLQDGEEVHKYRTNPLKADTDGDGLKDGDEVMKYKSDPVKADTDDDGLRDADEVMKYQTNPLKPDSDGDKLSDGDEVLVYKTDPLKADTDDDGLTDSEETLKYKTDPLKTDTDGDNLKDGEEVNTHKTNPLIADTDGGTVNDGVEILKATNPLDPSDDVPKEKEVLKVEVGKAIVLDGIVFKTGSAEISPESEEILSKAFNTLEQNLEIEVEIQGHTDNVGKRAMNMKLSQSRAESVKNYLAAKGISATRITTKGFGPDKPGTPNTTAEGKQKNRRIEFLRTK
jgi:outer membrane protein OmpA-like peptidoglycan-associated protein